MKVCARSMFRVPSHPLQRPNSRILKTMQVFLSYIQNPIGRFRIYRIKHEKGIWKFHSKNFHRWLIDNEYYVGFASIYEFIPWKMAISVWVFAPLVWAIEHKTFGDGNWGEKAFFTQSEHFCMLFLHSYHILYSKTRAC